MKERMSGACGELDVWVEAYEWRTEVTKIECRQRDDASGSGERKR